jgi:hypothetical protein
MPLLPQTRDHDDIADIEDLLDRCVTEVGQLVEAACEHMAKLRTYQTRLTRLRSGFDAARGGNRAPDA